MDNDLYPLINDSYNGLETYQKARKSFFRERSWSSNRRELKQFYSRTIGNGEMEEKVFEPRMKFNFLSANSSSD